MRSRVKWIPLLTLAAFAGCGGHNPPVTVVGAAADLRTLTGAWFGDYSSPLTGRTGSIVFELQSNPDSAFGRVVMTPHGAAGPIEPWRNPRGPLPAPTELTIRFVRVANGRVSGSLTPYADPATGEPLFTVFEGRVTGDTIEGTYTTRPGSNEPTGRWQVVRDRR